MQEKYSSVIASSVRYVVIDCIMIVFACFQSLPNIICQSSQFTNLNLCHYFAIFHSFSAVLGRSQMHAKIDTKTKMG